MIGEIEMEEVWISGEWIEMKEEQRLRSRKGKEGKYNRKRGLRIKSKG